MGCRNCGKESKRHDSKAYVRTADINESAMDGIEFGGKVGQPPVAGVEKLLEQLSKVREMSYEEIDLRRQQVQAHFNKLAEKNLELMSEAMRRIYIEELVNVINCDEVSPSGASPQQALKTLKQSFDREDFSFVTSIYPGLKEEVGKRYKELESKKLDLKTFITT